MVRAWLLTLLVACGRVGFAPVAGDADESIDGTPIDPCDLERIDLGVFSSPALVPDVNSTMEEDDPTPSDDGLELYFTSNRTGGAGQADLYRATRASASDPRWATVDRVVEMSSPQNENTPYLASDNLTLFLVTNRDGTGVQGMDDIWMATRANRLAPWTNLAPVVELNSPGLDRGPSLFHDGHDLLLHSDRAGAQKFYVSHRDQLTDPWSTPVLLNGPPGIRGWMSNCGLELYYEASNAQTDADLFVVRRDHDTDPFGPPRRLDELSSAMVDQDIRLSPDRHHVYFASNRDGDSNLYEASR